MPKLTHEAIVQLIRNAPHLVEPAHRPDATSIHITQTEFVDLAHAEYRTDDVLLYGDDPRAPERAHIVEVQLGVDHDKPDRWQLYVAGLRVRYRCPVDLVVVPPIISHLEAARELPGYAEYVARLTAFAELPHHLPVADDLPWLHPVP